MTAPLGTTTDAADAAVVSPVDPDAPRPGLIKRVTDWGTGLWGQISAWPFTSHILRALARFTDRLGVQFAGAITYFSLLSLVPILMVAFSIAGFVLADRPDLIAELKHQVTDLIPGTDLANQVGALIDQAVSARFTVGIIGLVIALYSGMGWMGNVRKALRAIWWPIWRGSEDIKDNIFLTYLKNLGLLAGLGLAVALSFVVTTIGSTTQGALLRWLGLDDSTWIGPVVRVVTLAIATFANLLIFLWCYARLPPKEYRAPIRPLLIGSVVAAFVFEALKSLLSLLIRGVSGSATAAVFGSTIGLMFFFNIVAQVFLMVGAWIATDVHTPGGTAPRTTRWPPPRRLRA